MAGAAWLLLWGAATASTAFSEVERAGQLIYEKGVGLAGVELTARMGDAEIPASALACAGCHGSEGLGRDEGGIAPPAVTWEVLTRPYGHVHAAGRRHQPFDEERLGRLLRTGTDPAGNRLSRAMPRYNLTAEEVRALVAYLRVIGRRADPAVTPTAIRIGVMVDDSAGRAGAGAAIRRVIELALDQVNRRGGIFGRRLEVVFYGVRETLDRAAFRRTMAVRPVAAWLVWMGARDRVALEELVGESGPPVVPASDRSLVPQDASADGRRSIEDVVGTLVVALVRTGAHPDAARLSQELRRVSPPAFRRR